MRLIARYALEGTEGLEVRTVYADRTEREVLGASVKVDSIAGRHPAAIWFERKLHDDFGIVTENAFDTRPLLHHERWPRQVHPMRRDFAADTVLAAQPFRAYAYEAVGGDGVFEVSVGPIHAGIIEPGHFHFSQAGEEMLHQEVRHFYKYRGIEKMCEGKTLLEAWPIVSRISGNASVAYQHALRDIAFAAAEKARSDADRAYGALLLELERIIHHLTDLGFIPNDAGFGAALAYCSMRAEEARRLMQRLSHHRFGFDALREAADVPIADEVRRFVETLREQMRWFEAWITDIPSLWDRFDTTGVLRRFKALKYNTVGVVARASGVALDRRDDAFYRARGFEMMTDDRGDVAARFTVRLKELFVSLRLMENLLDEAAQAALPDTSDATGEFEAFSEGAPGELYLFVKLERGRIVRFFARDPSFMNWQALHLMMPGNIIADFPLINKSCDLSYAGNDL